MAGDLRNKVYFIKFALLVSKSGFNTRQLRIAASRYLQA